MNDYAQNALLKILEEPPRYCTFILTRSEPRGLRPTVLSRLSVWKFDAPRPERSVPTGKKNGTEDGGTKNRILDRLFSMDREMTAPMNDWDVSKEEAVEILDELTEIFRDLYLFKLSPPGGAVSREGSAEWAALAKRFETDEIFEFLDALARAKEDAEQWANPRLFFWPLWRKLGIRFLR